MSYIKIEKIKKELIDTPEKGYIYFGYDDETVDGEKSGFWIKDENGEVYYIIGQNDSNPTISSIYPISSNNGDTITIYGSNFIPYSTNVTFNGILGENINVLSSIQLTCVVPEISKENVNASVVVSTPNGFSLPYFHNIIYKSLNPVITNISPITASIGDTIIIQGSNFIQNDTITWFSGDAGITHVVNSTQLNATIPQTLTGQTIVFLETSNGQSNIFNFEITDNNVNFFDFYPKIVNVGDIIHISGSNFIEQEIQVRLGATQASNITYHNSNYLTVTVPNNVVFGDTTIRVHNIKKDGLTINGDVLMKKPIINSISPLSAENGDNVTITGENLNGTLTVLFSGVPVNVIQNDNNSCIVELNNVTMGLNSVIIINSYNQSDIYPYSVSGPIGSPTITHFNRISQQRNKTVRVYGTNFQIGNTSNVVYFGNIASNASHYQNSNELLCSISNLTPIGDVDVKIVNSLGSFTMTGFTILEDDGVLLPEILNISPNFAKNGDIIDVYGNNLNNSIISFGFKYPGITGSTTIINNSHVKVTIPDNIINNGENKIFNVYATTLSGTCYYTPFEIYSLPNTQPKILSFDPILGKENTLINISGNSFTKYWSDIRIFIGGKFFILNDQQFISNNKISGLIPYTGHLGSSTIKVDTPVGSDQKSVFTIIPDCELICEIECDV